MNYTVKCFVVALILAILAIILGIIVDNKILESNRTSHRISNCN